MRILVIDYRKCTGCRVCEAVCSLVNEGEFDPSRSRIKVVRNWKNGYTLNVPTVCNQCEKAYCERLCPVGAIRREGVVIRVNGEDCIGCRICQMACPVGGITVDPTKGVAVKCELCLEREGPACARYCYAGAIKAVPAELARSFLAWERMEKAIEEYSR